MINKYTHKRNILQNKIRFIQEQIDDILILYKKKKDIVIEQLDNTGYMKLARVQGGEPDYEYLLSMRMDSVTEEKLNKLKEEFDDINNKITDLESKTNKDLWNEDLEEFSSIYEAYQSKQDKLDDLSEIKISSTLKTKANNKKKLAKKEKEKLKKKKK